MTQDLLSIIRDRAVVRADVTLSSGATSTWYADLRRVSLSSAAAPLLGSALLNLTSDWGYEAVGGLTLGADPLALAMLHGERDRRIDAFIVRKAPKSHGMGNRIEGPPVAGRRVLVVEDVSTTGASALDAVAAVGVAGGIVVGVAAVLDRGGSRRIREGGHEFRSLYTEADLAL